MNEKLIKIFLRKLHEYMLAMVGTLLTCIHVTYVKIFFLDTNDTHYFIFKFVNA